LALLWGCLERERSGGSVEKSGRGGLFIAGWRSGGGGRGQRESELAVAGANGEARADVGRCWSVT
jgi:hypothetical protein